MRRFRWRNIAITVVDAGCVISDFRQIQKSNARTEALPCSTHILQYAHRAGTFRGQSRNTRATCAHVQWGSLPRNQTGIVVREARKERDCEIEI